NCRRRGAVAVGLLPRRRQVSRSAADQNRARREPQRYCHLDRRSYHPCDVHRYRSGAGAGRRSLVAGVLILFALQALEDADKITLDADGEAWIICAQASLAEMKKQGRAILAELEKREAPSAA